MQTDVKDMKYWFLSNNHMEEKANTLEHLANLQSANKTRNEEVVKALIRVFSNVYEHSFNVIPYGSRNTGLATKDTSDLDLFIDTSDKGDNYLTWAKDYLRKTAEYMKETEGDVWSNIREIFGSTLVIKVLHFDTQMRCDITLNNSFGIIHSQLLILYLKNISVLRKLLLMIREWAVECDLIRDYKNMHNYGLSLMVLFYLQQEKYAPPVCELNFCYKGPRKNICGYDCVDYKLVNYNWNNFKSTKNIPLKTFLQGFFSYYACFDFNSDVICPFLGVPIKKNMFTVNGEKLPNEMCVYVKNLENRGEIFKINDKSINIQDPIDLSNNVTKFCKEEYLWNFVNLCEVSKKALNNIK